MATNAFSSIKNLEIAYQDASYVAIKIETINDEKNLFLFSFKDHSKTSEHQINIKDKAYKWVGAYQLINN
jgi:hypothetical protein